MRMAGLYLTRQELPDMRTTQKHQRTSVNSLVAEIFNLQRQSGNNLDFQLGSPQPEALARWRQAQRELQTPPSPHASYGARSGGKQIRGTQYVLRHAINL
jgi:hypothetical protein